MAFGDLFRFRGRPAAVFACIATLFLVSAAARAATITVTTVADDLTPNDGSVSLREAITAINAGNDLGDPDITAQNPGTFGTNDTINFNIGGGGVHTIAPTSALPVLTKPVLINGYSQPGSSPTTNAFPLPLNAVLLIELNGSASGGLAVGPGAAGSTIRGLVINRVNDGISITANNVTVAGNFIGTNPAGTAAQLNSGRAVDISIGNNVTVGGPAAADRNLLSGNNQGGVFVGLGVNNGILIQGNFIGPDVTGTTSLGAGISLGGITIRGSSGTNTNIINNLISGNVEGGIEDENTGGVIQGNLIGTQRDGTSPLPNGNFGGVILSNGAGGGILVGGGGVGQPNIIAFNTGFGIVLAGGTGNLISQNSIHDNAFLGISFGIKAGPAVNDNCDADTGPNNQQNYPVITSAVIAAGNVTISGTLNSTASADFHLEFFSNVACDPSGNGQGRTFLGSANVTTPVGNCNVSFGPLVFPVPAGQTVFTATANDFSNTSEFSACFPTGAPPPPTPTLTPTAAVPTPTATATRAGVPTSTPTPVPTPSGAAAAGIPTLAPMLLGLFALALALAAVLLVRRS